MGKPCGSQLDVFPLRRSILRVNGLNDAQEPKSFTATGFAIDASLAVIALRCGVGGAYNHVTALHGVDRTAARAGARRRSRDTGVGRATGCSDRHQHGLRCGDDGAHAICRGTRAGRLRCLRGLGLGWTAVRCGSSARNVALPRRRSRGLAGGQQVERADGMSIASDPKNLRAQGLPLVVVENANHATIG